MIFFFFFFSSRRRHTRFKCDWSSDVCSSDLCPARFRPGRGSETTRPRGSGYPCALGAVLALEKNSFVGGQGAQARSQDRRGERVAAADHARRGERELAPAVADLDEARREAVERRMAGLGRQLLQERRIEEPETPAAGPDLLLHANDVADVQARVQEEIGTGGGGFRFLYASFLQE